MFANLLFGLRDIWKHKIFFGVCTVFLVVFSIVAVMVSITIYNDYVMPRLMEPKTIETFEPVYTRYDLPYDRVTLENISGIYHKNAVSLRQSQSLTGLYGRPVYLVFGDGSIINSGIANQEGIAVYAYEPSGLNYIEILGVEHQVKPISLSDTCLVTGYGLLSSPDCVFVVYQGEAMVEIIHYMAGNNPYIFHEIIGDTWVLAEDHKRIEDFTDFVLTNVEGLAFKGYFYKGGLDSSFLFSYLLPLTLSLSMTGIMSFLVIFQGMLQKMQRDLTIHLQSGARFSDVLLRFYVFYGAIIGITLAALYIIRLLDFRTFIGPVICTSLFIIAASIAIYIARALKRTNLFENLRGDMV
ncbi:MAG TPA: hypothetical protein PLL81_03025 [Bacillota bacterium]|nr:hypothetical protein [Bacillota bacterium]HQE01824.1 hypothetical protein [Bacillota bacterium]